MVMNKTLLSGIFFFAAATNLLFGQIKNIDQNIVDKYLQEAGDHAALFFSPVEETINSARWANDPYWLTSSCTPGELVYDGILYKNLNMRLNVVKQTLSVATPESKILVCPDTAKIERFVLFGKPFIKKGNRWACIEYQSKDLALWHEKYKEKTADVVIDARSYMNYKEVDIYYIIENGKKHFVKKASDIPSCFPKYKKPLTKYVRNYVNMLEVTKLQGILSTLNYLDDLKENEQ